MYIVLYTGKFVSRPQARVVCNVPEGRGWVPSNKRRPVSLSPLLPALIISSLQCSIYAIFVGAQRAGRLIPCATFAHVMPTPGRMTPGRCTSPIRCLRCFQTWSRKRMTMGPAAAKGWLQLERAHLLVLHANMLRPPTLPASPPPLRPSARPAPSRPTAV